MARPPELASGRAACFPRAQPTPGPSVVVVLRAMSWGPCTNDSPVETAPLGIKGDSLVTGL